MLREMDEVSVAEELPRLYRHALERIADLERNGQRREAELLRASAIRVYSASWDAGATAAMSKLAHRAERVLAGEESARHARPEHPALRLLRLRRLPV